MTAALLIAVMVLLGLSRRVVADHARMRLIAEAEHELRAPLQAIALAAESAARNPEGRPVDLRTDVERARIALADLAAARSGRRADAELEAVRLDRLVWRAATASDLAARRAGGGVHLDWSAGPVTIKANHGRLAQALGNLLANAVEHGGGHVRVTGRRTRRGIRVEVRDSGHGHGLTIAAKAVRDSGGTLTAAKAGTGTAVAIELPVAHVASAESEAPARASADRLAGSNATLLASADPLADSDAPSPASADPRTGSNAPARASADPLADSEAPSPGSADPTAAA